jgi:hypothetical protein
MIFHHIMAPSADLPRSGTVADLMRPEERGLAMSLWAMGALFGPILGNPPPPTNQHTQNQQTDNHPPRSRLRRLW